MNTLYINYSEGRSGGELCEGEENGPYASHEPIWTTFQINGIYTPETWDNSNWYKEEIQVDFTPNVGMPVYVVIVRYSSGNTFGRVNGCWCIEGVYTSIEEAENIKSKIYDGTFEEYAPWIGYFEYLEYVDIEFFIIR